jgi:hypothetical protein
MVIVTADHGVSFTTGEPLRSVSAKNFPEIMWTPLFVKYPGQDAGAVDDRPAESIDVFPTIADVVGAEIPWKVDGQSLRGPERENDVRRMYQWGEHALEPPTALKPTDGKEYLEFDGAEGLAAVKATRAVRPDPDAALRIYRDNEYGKLVGREAEPLIKDLPGDEKAAMSTIHLFQDVRPKAKKIPWAYGEGFFNDLKGAQPIAIALNGKVVAVTVAKPFEDRPDSSFFTYSVPPSLVVPGNNPAQMFIIHGTPANPSLDPVWLHP